MPRLVKNSTRLSATPVARPVGPPWTSTRYGGRSLSAPRTSGLAGGWTKACTSPEDPDTVSGAVRGSRVEPGENARERAFEPGHAIRGDRQAEGLEARRVAVGVEDDAGGALRCDPLDDARQQAAPG